MARADFEANKAKVLQFVPMFLHVQGYQPSTREIAAGTGMSATTARMCLKALQEEGVIRTGRTGRQGQRKDLVAPTPTIEDEHDALVKEAARRLSLLVPGIAEDRLFYIAEQVAKAVERHNAKES